MSVILLHQRFVKTTYLRVMHVYPFQDNPLYYFYVLAVYTKLSCVNLLQSPKVYYTL